MKPGQLLKVQVKAIDKVGVELRSKQGEEVFMPHSQHEEQYRIGDSLWVGLFKDRQGKIKATTRIEKTILNNEVAAMDLKRGDEVMGQIYKVTDFGAFVVTPEQYIGLIHKDEMPHELKVGDRVAGRVTYVRPDGRFNMSLRALKEVARMTDAEIILEYLRQRSGGSMPFTDESDAEAIKRKFRISKSAFKRALGRLLKEGLIVQEEGWTTLTEKGKGNQAPVEGE